MRCHVLCVQESQAVLASKAAHVVFQLASGDELAAAHLNEAGFTRPLIGVMQMRPPKTIEASSKAGDISRAVWACVEETLNALAAMCSVPVGVAACVNRRAQWCVVKRDSAIDTRGCLHCLTGSARAAGG